MKPRLPSTGRPERRFAKFPATKSVARIAGHNRRRESRSAANPTPPAGQIAIGVQKATVTVTYLSTVEYFLVDFTGGQTVTPGSSLPIAA